MKKKVNILFRFQSLRTTILLPFLILISASVLVFMLISVQRSREITLQTSTDYTGQLIDMTNREIDSYFSNLENIAQLILNSQDPVMYLTFDANKQYTSDYYQCESRLERQFLTLRETRNDIYNIGIFGVNGHYLINDAATKVNAYADVQDKDWYQRALSGEEVLVYSHVQNLVQGEYPWVVTLARALKSPDTGEAVGVLFIDMNYSSISSLCERIELGSKGYVFIIDEEGTIVYHPRQQLLYSGIQTEENDEILKTDDGSFISGDGKRLYSVSSSNLTGCRVVGVGYLDELLKKSTELRRVFVLIAVIIIAIAFVLSVFIARMISEPIRSLGDSMREVEVANFDMQIENPGYQNVIGRLIASFNAMVVRIRELINRIKTEQAEKRRSELNALQAQIKPHFLYNTLDSIIWMAESRHMPEVIQMTSSLSKLLRKSISNDAEFVTVRDELEYVNEYLRIQQMRYRDKLEYVIDTDPEAARAYTAKLMIQPLVENAIYHGIKRKENGGTIRVSAKCQEQRIVITVADDGAGMKKETLEHLLDEQPPGSKHVGVYNVNQRIKLYYGPDYGLRYTSEEGKGTTVDVVIPFKET